jgi:hypothetical protein
VLAYQALLLLLIPNCQSSLQHQGLLACWLDSAAAKKAEACQDSYQRGLSDWAAPHCQVKYDLQLLRP